MSVVELPDIRLFSNKSRTRSKKSEFDKFRNSAVYKSVDKMIKYNSVSCVLGNDNDYYPKILEDQKKVDEAKEVHANLTELKKSCDGMKMSGNNKDKEIEKMRKEIDQMAIQIDQYNQIQKEQQGKEKELDEKFKNQQNLLSQSSYDKKIFEHMLSRMKKDQVTFQLRANQYERHLKTAISANNSSSMRAQQFQVLYAKTMQALQEVKYGVKQQLQNREKNIQRFKNELKQKHEVEQKRDDRIKRQQEIAEVAANDIRDGALKKWRKLLLVHKFLNMFLKSKMQRGIDQFQHLEDAFQKIKASTGVSDAQEIVQKFIGREQTYAHLLISISDYEKKIGVLKQENVDLKNNLHHLKQEYSDMDKEFHVETHKIKDQMTEQDKFVLEVEEKAIITGLLQNKMGTWISRNLKKLGLSKEKGFLGIIEALKEKLLSLSQMQQQELLNKSLISTIQEVNDQEFVRRNFRIKPKKQNSNLYSNNSQDYSILKEDEELFDELQMDQNQQEGLDEEHLLIQLREEIKKGKKMNI